MEEPWEEALDLDDSDSSNSLLPLNHHTTAASTSTVNSTAALSQPFLQRCSQNFRQSSPPPPPSSPRLIPGPAGAVQAAIYRYKSLTRRSSMDDCEDPVPTQEYIRRAVEDDGGSLDGDFDRHPWLSAVQFIRREGLVIEDGAIGVPLSAIKSGFKGDKVSQAVAIFKSCTPNGLGDMLVTLKDPTGTIDASVHRKVFTEGKYGKDISDGAVVILQKVAVFTPFSKTYLNITLDSIFKVISKDDKASMDEVRPTSEHESSVPDLADRLRVPEKPSSTAVGRTEGILNSLKQRTNIGNAHTEGRFDISSLPIGGSCSGRFNMNQNTNHEREDLMCEDSNTCTREAVTVTDNDTNHVASQKPKPVRIDKTMEGPPHTNASTCISETSNKQASENSCASQRQVPASRAMMPQWTDEQLEELFAFD